MKCLTIKEHYWQDKVFSFLTGLLQSQALAGWASCRCFSTSGCCFPHEYKDQSSSASLGTRSDLGEHMRMQGETFMQPSKFLASSSLKKSFHILPSPLNCPNTSEITTSLFAANGEICFTASTGRKQNTPFGRKNVFASLLQKGQYMSLSGSLMFQNGSQTPWFSHRCGVLRARKLLFLLLLKYSDRLSHWAWVCGVLHRIPHEVPMPRGSTNTLLYFCLGWIPTLIPAVGLCLVSPTQS